MSEWRDIESAPRFEAVLIAGGNVLYPVAASLNKTKSRGPWKWSIDAQGACFGMDDAYNMHPTHWMPLPAPPEEKP